ncbi:MAG: SoxR reducing system RseC family protein [Candidatus Ozemobacteraceae bacterium]
MRATIIAFGSRPGRLIVETRASAQCNSCQACRGISGGEEPSPKKFEVLSEFPDLLLGTQVEVDAESGFGSLAALLLFGVPLLGFFIGLAAAGVLGATLDFGVTEGRLFLGGLFGLCCGVLVSFLATKCIGADYFLLRVKRVIADGETCGEKEVGDEKTNDTNEG